MSRTLSALEIKKIDAFVATVGPEITAAQPIYNSFDADIPDPTPQKIRKRLVQLIALSNNDHLLNYLQRLNTSDNQVDILMWLDGIYAAQKNIVDANLNDNDKLYRNIYRQAASLAIDTSLCFAANTFKAISQLPYPSNLKKVIAFVQEAKEAYASENAKNRLRNSFEQYGFSTYLSVEELKQVLLKHSPAPVLYRSRSAISPRDVNAINTLSPLRSHVPVTVIDFPARKRLD